MVIMNYKSGMINVFNRKRDMVNQTDSILLLYPNRKYRGEPFYHSLRYSYTFEDRLQAGFVARKMRANLFGTHIIKDMTFIPHIYS